MTAFQGVRVLDCSEGLAGPLASMLLADFGAEVLKIEPPEGDRAQREPGYLVWNRGKRRLTLDLGEAGGRARFDALIGGADLAVFDHAPSRLAALGLTGAELTARHPRLVHLWTPPFGTEGRLSELPAHHATLTGLVGSAFRQGAYADQPVWHVAQILHHAQGVLAATAAGAALLQRGPDGRGRSVVVSGLHAAAQASCPISVVGAPQPPRGRPLGSAPNYRLYRCGDGAWLFLATLFAHFFQRALKTLGLQDAPPGADIGAAIEAVLATRPREHWLALLRAADVPAGPVCRRDDFLRSEIVRANDLAATLGHPTLGPVEMVGAPVQLQATPATPGALMGEASEADLAAFREAGPGPAQAQSPRGPPLAGLRVLDLGTVIAGTYAGTILANLGADVVKVESKDGDPFRYAQGFINYNRGKRGLGLDLKSDAGRQAFLDMAREADVVVDNYRLGVRERLGIGYEALAAVNPRLVSCSINTYGSRGAEARLPGFDPLMQARSGLMAAQGGEDGEPVFHAIPVNDVASAASAAFAIVAALHARARTGRGQNTETSLAAQSALFQSGDLVVYAGRRPPRQGARDCLGFSALDRYYEARDGWLTLACTRDAEVGAVARALQRPDWERRWAPSAALAEPPDGALAREIAEALVHLDRDAAVKALQAAGAAAAPVRRGGEALGCDWLWANGYYELHAHPEAGEIIAGRGFAAFDGATLGFERLEPRLGGDGPQVLLDYGFTRKRIAALAEAGVIFRG